MFVRSLFDVFVAGQLYILSRDLVEGVLSVARLSSPASYVEGIEDHDIGAMAYISAHGQPMNILQISETNKFWKHPVKRRSATWEETWVSEIKRIQAMVSESTDFDSTTIGWSEIHLQAEATAMNEQLTQDVSQDFISTEEVSNRTPLNKDHKLLVLMNVKIGRAEQITPQMKWIQEDYSEVCKFHSTCKWMIQVVAADSSLVQEIQEATSALDPSIEWTTSVSTETFNKFIFVQTCLGYMSQYDLVLLKDSDQRVASFSWQSFLEKKSNAVISGPLRRTTHSSCEKGQQARQTYQFHEACHWEDVKARPAWSSRLYDEVAPLDVLFLEQYFVLFDAEFARFFFSIALRPGLVQPMSSWGLDWAWCAAARAWDGSRPGCYLLPLASDHEDTRQIQKHHIMGRKAIERYESDPIIGRWIKSSSAWLQLIHGGKDLADIEHECRLLLGWSKSEPFDLQACSTHIGKMNWEGFDDTSDSTLHLIERELQGAAEKDSQFLNLAKKTLEEHSHPPFVKFDLHDHEVTESAVEDFAERCNFDGGWTHPRSSLIHDKFQWQKDPACRSLAEHPRILNAARKVMGLSNDSPVYLHGVQKTSRKAGDVHRLHSDLESDTPGCGEREATSIWVMLKSDCPEEKSPLTLVSGSHILQTADQELIDRKCWSSSRADLPCNVTAILEDAKTKNAKVEIVSGPTKPLAGIAWPTTAWHMTKDTCNRMAALFRYTSSASCARSLAYKYPEASFGQFTKFPDAVPFVQIGGQSKDKPDAEFALDYLHRFPSTDKTKKRCKDEPLFPTKDAPAIEELHLSGQYHFTSIWGAHIGELRLPASPTIQSKRFYIRASRMLYSSKKRQNLPHGPHIERGIEICTVIRGQINYALAAACQDYYDVVSLGERQVAVLFPGIYHTNSAGVADGEHVCFKILPIEGIEDSSPLNMPTALEASRIATKSMDVDLESYFDSGKNRELTIVNSLKRGKVLPPGYRHLVVKVSHYQKGGTYKVHADGHDLIVLAISGSLVIKSGNKETLLPEHEHAFIPAGVQHGFEAPDGPARVLFIEIG